MLRLEDCSINNGFFYQTGQFNFTETNLEWLSRCLSLPVMEHWPLVLFTGAVGGFFVPAVYLKCSFNCLPEIELLVLEFLPIDLSKSCKIVVLYTCL